MEDNLKNEKKENKMKVIAVLVIIILLFSIIGVLIYHIYQNRDNIMFGMATTTKDYTNIIIQEDRENYNQKGSKIKLTYVFTMDKKEKCINSRVLVENLDEKTMQEMYEGFERSTGDVSNIQKYDNKLSANLNLFYGKTKNEIINQKPNCSIVEI